MLLRTATLIVLVAVCALSALAQQHALTIRVVAPPSTPKDARLVVVGSDSLWGQWNPTSGVPLARENDSVWTVTRQVPADYTLEFKVTRGPWSTEAIYEPGKRPPNTAVVVMSDTVLTLRPVDWYDFTTPIPSKPGGITGTVRYHHSLESDRLRYTRDIIVWLPPSYFTARTKRYPVLYMQDGQNIVDPTTSAFGFDWRADEVADSLIRAKAIEELIIVGIYNTPDRAEEYSGSQKGRDYADFVAHILKPFIDRKYRTMPDARHTAVMGSSLGGLISFLFAWWYPEVFSQAGCLSSVFHSKYSSILEQVGTYGGPKKRIRVYLDVGGKGMESNLKPGNEKMCSMLKDRGYAVGRDLEFFYDAGAEHNEQAWASRLYRPLLFMFGTRHTQ